MVSFMLLAIIFGEKWPEQKTYVCGGYELYEFLLW